MNTARILNAWASFRLNLDGAIRSDRLDDINLQFDLDSDFRHKDLNDLLAYLDGAIENIQIIRDELQR